MWVLFDAIYSKYSNDNASGKTYVKSESPAVGGGYIDFC